SMRRKRVKDGRIRPPEVMGGLGFRYLTGPDSKTDQTCYLALSQAFQATHQNCTPGRLKNSQNFWVGECPPGIIGGADAVNGYLGNNVRPCVSGCFGCSKLYPPNLVVVGDGRPHRDFRPG